MRPVRVLGTVVGLGAVVGILAGRAVLAPVLARTVRSAREEVPVAEPAVPPNPAGPAGRRVRVVRLALAGAGLLVLLLGLWKVLHAVQPGSYLWLAVWLLGAILLSDALVAPLVTVVRALAHRVMPGSSPALAWLKGGFAVAGVLVLVVVPEIWAQHLGPANPTVLPGDYAARLLVTLAVVAAVTIALVLGSVARGRRRTA